MAARVAVGLSALCTVADPGFIVLSGDIGHAGGSPLAAAVIRAVAIARDNVWGAVVLR
jgi:hypothetical protein